MQTISRSSASYSEKPSEIDSIASVSRCSLRRNAISASLRRGDVAPRADHLDRLAVLVADQVLLVDHPAVAAVLLEEPVLDRVAAFLEQQGGLGLHRREVVGVHAAPPEIRVLQVFLRLVAEPVPDVLADEGRREVARRLEAVDHRRRAGQQVHEPVLRGDQGLAELLARGDVAPGADHLDRLARRVAQHLQLVADPAVAAVLLAEAVFAAEPLLLEQARIGLEDARAVLGMDAALPEIRALEVLLALVAEQVLDVLADEGRREIAGGLEAVDHRRRAGEQVLDALAGRGAASFGLLALGDVAPRADHLDRLAVLVADQALLVVDPAVGAVLLEEPVLDRVAALPEQVDGLAPPRRRDRRGARSAARNPAFSRYSRGS